MTRSVPTWVGASDDVAIPPRVKLRVFERYGGKCYVSGIKIRPGDAWQCDHVVALCNGGRHAEDNLAPILSDAHKAKTAVDVGIKAKTDRIRAKHLGAFPKPKRKLQSRGFEKRAP